MRVVSRDELTGKWRAFRGRSVYYQLRALVLLVYVVVAVISVALVIPRPHFSRNALDARVTVLPGDAIGGRYYVVENESGKDWVEVRFELEGGYEQRRGRVPAGEKVTLVLTSFTKPASGAMAVASARVSAPTTHRSRFLRIEAQGKTTLKWFR